ncbi:MAG: hypothetical protein J7L83_02185 [Thaumarchaeota archaeon]|nr:hypothetical protein [Nitrososphaerota archaeon]
MDSTSVSEAVLDKLIDVFGIKTHLTERVDVPGISEGARVFKVKGFPKNCEVYIIDNLAGKDIACHPHIVGEELAELSLKAAEDAAKAILELTDIREYGEKAVVYEHVLRAAPGYRLHEALREIGVGFREVWIRPRYVIPSYRDHDEIEAKKLEIVYEDFSNLPRRELLLVLKPDTEASGRTGEISLKRLAEVAEERNSALEELIVYGFISKPGLESIYEVAKNVGFKKVYFFAVGDVTALCYNMYDMPLYGPDESYYSELGGLKLLGGIADYSTLERYLPEFIPGADQPGDWSARQTKVYTGYSYEPGGIENHLKNSIKLIEELWKISKDQDWFMDFHEKAIKKELRELENALSRYANK